MDINLPEAHAEMSAAFARYEAALVGNDTAELDALFWASEFTVRYGVAENLIGIEAIRRFRAARPSVGLARSLQRTSITTFGTDFATATTEFARPADARPGAPARIGRQSQTWVRFDGRWRVVAAHVSVIDSPPPTHNGG